MAVKKAAEKTVAEKKPAAKKPAAKKVAEAVEKAEKVVEAVEKKVAAKKAAEVIIHSPLGGEITGAEILARTGNVDKVYVRVDENKAYWVRGEETGSVDLW
ncbi:MAG: hypothetical protein J6P42_00210 [Oscillospiraceae bacterium]|nr:hypothetical protein [Oscillospiraceae bacterium]